MFSVSLLAAWLVGYSCGRRSISQAPEVKRDTVFLSETLHIAEPVEVLRTVTQERLVYVRDTLHTSDTVYLPREVRVYEDSAYRCQVSGYQPSLDWIDIVQRERVIRETYTETKWRNHHWGVGIQAGYGVTLVDSKARGVPYIGLGISWNFLTF